MIARIIQTIFGTETVTRAKALRQGSVSLEGQRQVQSENREGQYEIRSERKAMARS